jgi:hypothetical protein
VRRLVLATAAGAAALAASGCGGSGTACLEGAATGPRSGDATTSGTAYLTDVDVSRPGCADRVEFRFESGLPAYRVEYRPTRSAQTEDASGRHIPIDGSAFLVVRLDGAATAKSDDDRLTRTYVGPRRLGPDGARQVREVVKTGDFEAVVTWAIGLDKRRPFSVAASGSSLVVEVA